MIDKKELKRAWAEIYTDRLKRNVEKCRSLIGESCELMCVVKANCYGHGIERIIPCLQNEAGVKMFAVSNLVEAIELRDLGVKGEILILGYTPAENAEELCRYDITAAVTEYDYAVELSKNCPVGKSIRVHIAIDTGMTRIGIRCKTVKEICDEVESICSLDRICAEGIFTHLCVADSDSPEDISYTDMQKDRILSVKNELSAREISIRYTHFLNSAGAACRFDPRSDIARFGIMLYGISPDIGLKLPVDLEPVMELKATVSQVRSVEAGVSVSYGRTFITDRETRIATVTIGYADGYPRLLSGKADVLVRGKRARILGRICMDQLMIDVSDIEGVTVGDTVTLFGSDGEESIDVNALASIYGSIGYEIVCGISPRVPRIFID